jgi:hypothetical protein
MSSGGVYAGIIRHMRPTRDGNLLIHQSSTNRIILVTLPSPAATQVLDASTCGAKRSIVLSGAAPRESRSRLITTSETSLPACLASQRTSKEL